MENSFSSNPNFALSTYNASFHGDLETNEFLRKMPYRRLGETGLNVSLLSYGGSSLGTFYGDEINQKSIDAIQKSIKNGVNYIDTSPWYGDSEKLLGQALKDVPRNSYYIGTKVGRNFTETWQNRFDFTRSAVLKNVENSLQLLGVDYVDIIQIHDAEFCLEPKVILQETIPALESVIRAGKAKYIGVTGYSLETLKQIIESSPVKMDTVLSYCRMNFHDTSLLDYIPYFKSKNVGVINAAPVAMGLYTTRGPPDWHPASQEIKNITKTVATKIAKQGKKIEDAALGFSLRPKHLSIATTLVSMPNEEILEHNLRIVTSQISDEDEILYSEVLDSYKGSAHWEGTELEEYKREIGNQ